MCSEMCDRYLTTNTAARDAGGPVDRDNHTCKASMSMYPLFNIMYSLPHTHTHTHTHTPVSGMAVVDILQFFVEAERNGSIQGAEIMMPPMEELTVTELEDLLADDENIRTLVM